MRLAITHPYNCLFQGFRCYRFVIIILFKFNDTFALNRPTKDTLVCSLHTVIKIQGILNQWTANKLNSMKF